MIVVSDTSPINYLLLIEAIDILPKLFDQVLVPPAVLAELKHPNAPKIVGEWVSNPPLWIQERSPALQLASTQHLGAGEADAIALAKELEIPELLIDERRGTRVARNEGLIPLPTLALIGRAAEKNLINLRQAIERLKATNMRLSDQLIEAALLGEAKRNNSFRH